MVVLLSLLAGFGMLAGWDGLRRNWQEDWSSGALSWITLVLLPLAWMVSEVGRGLMWARWIGQAPQWRLRWLGLVPMWLLDPADLARLRQRTQRLSVNLWGLLYATLLVAVSWVASHLVADPTMESLARAWFHAAVLALLVFHLNPFWDGVAQGLLQEWWHLPELGGASRRWWTQRALALSAWLSGQRLLHPAARARAVRMPWLVVLHGPLGWCLHGAAAIWLVQWFGVHHPTLALALLVSASWALVVRPLVQGFVQAWRALDLAQPGARWRFALATAVVLGLVAHMLLVVPWTRCIVTQGVVTLPEHMVLRAPVDGRVTEMVVVNGQSVYEGQSLLAVRPLALEGVDPDADAMIDAPGHWGLKMVSSPGTGRVIVDTVGGLQDRVVRQGQVLARLMPHSPPQLSWAVPARHAQALQQVSWIRARPVDQPEQLWSVTLSSLVSKPATQLPAAALSARKGGAIPVLDSDPKGMTPAEPMIAMQAQLVDPVARVGGRVWVRLELPPQPLGWQLWTRVHELWRAARLGG